VDLDGVRSIYAEWERGDVGSAAWANREIVSYSPTVPNTAAGLAGISDGWRGWLSAVQDLLAVEREAGRQAGRQALPAALQGSLAGVRLTRSGRVAWTVQRQRHEGAIPTRAVVAERSARPESCACVKRPSRSKPRLGACLNTHPAKAAIAGDAEEMVDHRSANPATSSRLGRVHGL
jgi:hypothetical protein